VTELIRDNPMLSIMRAWATVAYNVEATKPCLSANDSNPTYIGLEQD